MKTTGKILMLIGLIAFFSTALLAQTPDGSATTVKSTGKTAVATQGKVADDTKTGGCNAAAKAACAPGKNFVDKNSDGKCDNCGSTGTCKGQGNCGGKGAGAGCGKGNGAGCSKEGSKSNCCGTGQSGCGKKAGCGSK